MRRTLVTVSVLALSLVATAAAYTPNDPLAPSQWYLALNRTFDAWPEPPVLAPVRVAIVDSGIDRGHPAFQGRIAAARSFVGGTPDDEQGHGTIVAGIVAAATDDGIGTAGSSPSAQLLVAKVVTRDGTVPVEAEARALRWAADAGARVINVSLGGLRDPADVDRDTYSVEESEAIAYAVSKGALVVAAVGNGDQAPAEPWRFASYPAALPQVLGVGALGRSGNVPAFSNRDPIYVDLVAPGQEIVSTFPLSLTSQSPGCVDQGTTICASGEYRDAEGTSFAAPQVTAAAVTLLALAPTLRAEQVRSLLERTAVDVTATTGCGKCAVGRDLQSGWGRLDVAAAVAALAAPLPGLDRLEPNDDAGAQARRLWGPQHAFSAVIDFWDDQSDVYAVFLKKGERLVTTLTRDEGTRAALVIWRPDTDSVDDLARQDRRLASVSAVTTARLTWRAKEAGWHAVQVKALEAGDVAYRLVTRKGG
jgi:Subtilase family